MLVFRLTVAGTRGMGKWRGMPAAKGRNYSADRLEKNTVQLRITH